VTPRRNHENTLISYYIQDFFDDLITFLLNKSKYPQLLTQKCTVFKTLKLKILLKTLLILKVGQWFNLSVWNVLNEDFFLILKLQCTVKIFGLNLETLL